MVQTIDIGMRKDRYEPLDRSLVHKNARNQLCVAWSNDKGWVCWKSGEPVSGQMLEEIILYPGNFFSLDLEDYTDDYYGE